MTIPEPKRDPENFERTLLNRFTSGAVERVLDIGCGDGRLTRYFAQNAQSVIGTDVELEKLMRARTISTESISDQIYFTAAEAELMPFASEIFDLAIFSWSL